MPQSGPTGLTRRTFCSSILAAVVGAMSGCGTILYPERRGQSAGKIDWTIVALDGIGMLFFFVPGVVAFAVDFATGTIYLPPESCSQAPKRTSSEDLQAVTLDHSHPTIGEIETAVATTIGQEIRLEPGRYHTRELNSLDEFWSAEEAAWAGHQLPKG